MFEGYLILKEQQYDDIILERDLHEYVDDLNEFQSRHKNKEDSYWLETDKRILKKDLVIFDQRKLALIAYHRTKYKILTFNRERYFDSLIKCGRNELIEIILQSPKKSLKKSPKKHPKKKKK